MPLGTNMDITYHFYYIYIFATSCRAILSKIFKKALQAPKKQHQLSFWSTKKHFSTEKRTKITFPEKIVSQKERIVFQPSIFGCFISLSGKLRHKINPVIHKNGLFGPLPWPCQGIWPPLQSVGTWRIILPSRLHARGVTPRTSSPGRGVALNKKRLNHRYLVPNPGNQHHMVQGSVRGLLT